MVVASIDLGFGCASHPMSFLAQNTQERRMDEANVVMARACAPVGFNLAIDLDAFCETTPFA